MRINRRMVRDNISQALLMAAEKVASAYASVKNRKWAEKEQKSPFTVD